MTAAILAIAHPVAAAPVQPFADFFRDLASVPARAYVGQSGSAVSDLPEFENMRQYLVTLYDGVHPSHSYALDEQIFDCVPAAEQPGVRLRGLTQIAEPPPSPPNASPVVGEPTGDIAAPVVSQPCEAGTIPMRRIGLDEVARFDTLRHFFEKGPGGGGRALGAAPPSLPPTAHAYAHEYQIVNNYGGYSLLGLWDPKVITGAPYHEIFSLAQHWYVGGSGAQTQTAEVGWQNYPQHYSTTKSVLFIYWTADFYRVTGCYNLECIAFIQSPSSHVHLGGTFPNYSKVGGKQHEIAIGYYLHEGNWWLAVGNEWVGYYPVALYRGGQMSHNAQVIDFGGETVGNPYWPAMGSGKFAALGNGKAAYQRRIVYRDAGNTGHAPILTRVQQSPACYTASPLKRSAGSWGSYFFFGGPGGKLGVC